MNKTLFDKVKAKCKDTGLSEKYLKAITEKMGGSIEDDSTDETAIEAMANQIAEVSVETQGEATRWANKKDPKDPKEPKEPKDPKDPKEPKEPEDEKDARIKVLEEKLAKFDADQAKNARTAAVQAAISKHKIPEWRTKGLSVPDDEDPDTYMASIKQDLITQNLMPADAEGAKATNEKAIDEAADSLLESITVK